MSSLRKREPKLREQFVVAIDTISTYAGIIVRIEDGQGHIGWGEAAPPATILGCSKVRPLMRGHRAGEGCACGLGDEPRLCIDANQGWSRREAIHALTHIAWYNVELVEQPVAADDIEGLALVRRAQPIPVMADESVHLPVDALKVINEGAVDYIKIMKSGGFWKSQQVALLAETAGIGCQVGGMVETELGLAAAINLVCGLPNIQFGDLDMGSSLRERLIKRGGSIFEDGCMVPGDRPGLGIEEINEQAIGTPLKCYKL